MIVLRWPWTKTVSNTSIFHTHRSTGTLSHHSSEIDDASETESNKPPPDVLAGIEQIVEAVFANPSCELIMEQKTENMDTNLVVDKMAEAIKIAVMAKKMSEVSLGMVESMEPGHKEEDIVDEDYVKGLADIEEGYSQAHGNKIVWEEDVNLLPPGIDRHVGCFV